MKGNTPYFQQSVHWGGNQGEKGAISLEKGENAMTCGGEDMPSLAKVGCLAGSGPPLGDLGQFWAPAGWARGLFGHRPAELATPAGWARGTGRLGSRKTETGHRPAGLARF